MGWGFEPGPWFGAAVHEAETLRAGGASEAEIRTAVAERVPLPAELLRASGTLPFQSNIRPEMDGDADNIAKVAEHMVRLMRLPMVRAGAIMPDACTSDRRPGSFPVGGVVATEGTIHPGMHSADICCVERRGGDRHPPIPLNMAAPTSSPRIAARRTGSASRRMAPAAT